MSIADFVRERLGHEPRDIRLFELAFTHSSLGSDGSAFGVFALRSNVIWAANGRSSSTND